MKKIIKNESIDYARLVYLKDEELINTEMVCYLENDTDDDMPTLTFFFDYLSIKDVIKDDTLNFYGQMKYKILYFMYLKRDRHLSYINDRKIIFDTDKTLYNMIIMNKTFIHKNKFKYCNSFIELPYAELIDMPNLSLVNILYLYYFDNFEEILNYLVKKYKLDYIDRIEFHDINRIFNQIEQDNTKEEDKIGYSIKLITILIENYPNLINLYTDQNLLFMFKHRGMYHTSFFERGATLVILKKVIDHNGVNLETYIIQLLTYINSLIIRCINYDTSDLSRFLSFNKMVELIENDYKNPSNEILELITNIKQNIEKYVLK